MRNSARFAGSWYPAQKTTLEQQLVSALDGIDLRSNPVRAGIVPHAGLSFSARGMAPLFGHLPDRVDRVIVMAPSHYEYLAPDRLYGEQFASHETPLGDLRGGPDLWERSQGAEMKPRAIQREHAVEMYLPFLAHRYGESAPVNAILVPELSSPDAARKLSSLLFEALNRVGDPSHMVYVASSDFTHYGARFGFTPYGRTEPEELERKVEAFDRQVLDAAAEVSVSNYWRLINDGSTTI